MRELIVGLDIGGTKTEALIVDQDDQPQGHAVLPTITGSPEAMLEGIVETVYAAIANGSQHPHQITCMGVGIPGRVLPETGEVQLAVNLGLKSYPLGERLTERIKVPVFIENDVRVAAIGAYHHLREREAITSMAYLGIGTGINAGIILDGKVYRGANGMAGEIGHMVMDEGGALCNCGQHGCLESIAAGPAITRQAIEVGLTDHNITTHELIGMAEAGNARAQALMKRVTSTLARAVQLLILTYDVEKVVLGGGVTKAGPAFLDLLLVELAGMRSHSDIIRMLIPDQKLALLPANFNAGADGAIRLAQEGVAALRNRASHNL
jgi:glucokinase